MPPVQTHHPRRRRALEIEVSQNAVFGNERIASDKPTYQD
jgi:hypothetical protein